jgi:hypothetical protein
MRSALIPGRWRTWWWLASDPAYRQRYSAILTKRRERERGWAAATAAIWPQCGGRIVSGPFTGLRYVRSVGATVFPQKLLGTYERELAGVIETICGTAYEHIIDIGAAEGYYVSGLASRIPRAHVTAFEAGESVHSTLREIATMNGVSARIDIRGLCTVDALRSVCAERAGRHLIVCDAEGAEESLLDPAAVPDLRTADMLVEVHDEERPNVSRCVRDRFVSTHRITAISPEPRRLEDLPPGIVLDPATAIAAMDECRGAENGWLWMSGRR